MSKSIQCSLSTRQRCHNDEGKFFIFKGCIVRYYSMQCNSMQYDGRYNDWHAKTCVLTCIFALLFAAILNESWKFECVPRAMPFFFFRRSHSRERTQSCTSFRHRCLSLAAILNLSIVHPPLHSFRSSSHCLFGLPLPLSPSTPSINTCVIAPFLF